MLQGTRFAVLILAIVLGSSVPGYSRADEPGHGGPVRALDLLGGTLASGGFDYSVICWRGDELTPFARHTAHAAPVNAVMIVPESGDIWSGDQAGTVLAWSPESPELPQQVDQRSGAVADLRRSADGTRIAAAGWDGRIVLYGSGSRDVVRELDAGIPLTSVRFADGDGTIVGADTAGNIHVWRADPAAADDFVIEGDGLPIPQIELLGDGDHLLSISSLGKLSIWSLGQSKRVTTVDAHERAATALAVSPVSDLAATADAGGTIVIWRISEQRAERIIEVESGPVWALAFSGDGEQLLSGSSDGTIRRWNIGTGTAIAITGTPGRYAVAATDDQGARLFNACRACHSITPDDENKAGPTFYRLFGRKAGTVPDYPYSKTLSESDIVWTEDTLGALFRDGPDRYVPGSRMPLQRMPNDADRAALIAHIRRLTSAGN